MGIQLLSAGTVRDFAAEPLLQRGRGVRTVQNEGGGAAGALSKGAGHTEVGSRQWHPTGPCLRTSFLAV